MALTPEQEQQLAADKARIQQLIQYYASSNLPEQLKAKVIAELNAKAAAAEQVATSQASPETFTFGTSPDYVPTEMGRYGDLADQVRNRTAPTVNYDQANISFAQAQDARANMESLARRYADLEAGRGPSLAQMQLQRGLDQTNALAASRAASAGGSGVSRAAAQRAAILAQGDANMNSVHDAAELRAKEQLAAMAAQGDLYGNIRSGDIGTRGQSIGAAQFVSDLDLRNRGLNDSTALGYEKFKQDIADAKFRADQAKVQNQINNVKLLQGISDKETANLDKENADTADSVGRFAGPFGSWVGKRVDKYGESKKWW